MTVTYQIKRFDLVKTYFYNLRHTRSTRLVVLGMASILVLFSLYSHYRLRAGFTLHDVALSLLYGVVFILLLPLIWISDRQNSNAHFDPHPGRDRN
jgi:hypothetical protein